MDCDTEVFDKIFNKDDTKFDLNNFNSEEQKILIEKNNKRHQKIKEIEEKYIWPCLTDDLSTIDVEKVFKNYRGEEHMSSLVGEKYDFRYEPESVENRWESQKSNVISKDYDVYHQILVERDCLCTLTVEGKEICNIVLKAHVPFKLDFPIKWVNGECGISFYPSIDEYEFTYINVWQGWKDGDPLAKYMDSCELLLPHLGCVIRDGVVVLEKSFMKKLSSWSRRKKIVFTAVGAFFGLVLWRYYGRKRSVD